MHATQRSTPKSGTFFRENLIIKYFYSHSSSSADSRRAVVSYWRKNVHLVLVNGYLFREIFRLTSNERHFRI